MLSQPTIQAVFVIPPKVHLLDITGPAHVFYEATDYGAPLKLWFCNVHKGETDVDSSSALAFYKLSDFNHLQLNKGDLIIVPGLESVLLLDNAFLTSTRAFQHWLRQQHAAGVTVCSVCTGAFLLAEAGLLDNRECTTHWKYLERFAKRYPKVKLLTNRLFVKSDGVYTSAGVASGIDLSLHIIEEMFGANFAAAIAKEVVVYHRRSEGDPQLSAFLQHRNHLDNRIHTVQDILSQSIEKRVDIEYLAAQVYMSPRNLTRLFKKTTQVTIGQYIDQLRKEHATALIKQGYTRQEAAQSCGLKSAGRLTKLLAD